MKATSRIFAGLLALSFALSAFASEGAKPASVILADASAIAKRDHKTVMVIFHASWCGWCHRLEKVLAEPDVKKVMDDHFVSVTLTVLERDNKKSDENPGAPDLMKQMKSDDSLPLTGFLDPDGAILATTMKPDGEKLANIGYPGEPDEIKFYLEILKKSSPSLTDAEIATIKKALDAEAVVIHAKTKAG